MTEQLFEKPADGWNRNYYSIYLDVNGDKWIKFWGKFLKNGTRRSHPWKMQEYFGADFRYENFLSVPLKIVRESLTEIRATIGDMTDEEALDGMNHFFERYSYPPLPGQVRKLPVRELTEDTPCGLYVE